MIDRSFWDRLRVKALLDRYAEGFIEYAMVLQDEYNLTCEQIHGVIKMINLSQLSATWKKVAPLEASFSNLPDGDYVGDLKEMKLEEAKKSGRVQVTTTIEVVDGDLTGQTCKRFDGLTQEDPKTKKQVANETGMGHFKRIVEVIGLDLPEDMNLWQETFDAFIANNVSDLFNITVKTNNNFSNVYINGLSEYTKTADGEEAAAEEVVEEAVEEEVVETQEEVAEEELEVVEEQQVVAPIRRVVAKPAAKPVAKVVAQPAKKAVVAAQPVKKVVAQAQPVRKIVSLRK